MQKTIPPYTPRPSYDAMIKHYARNGYDYWYGKFRSLHSTGGFFRAQGFYFEEQKRTGLKLQHIKRALENAFATYKEYIQIKPF